MEGPEDVLSCACPSPLLVISLVCAGHNGIARDLEVHGDVSHHCELEADLQAC